MTGQPPHDGEDDRVLAAEYALGLLSPEETAEVEARLPHEPELRALYAAWAEDFAGLTDDIPEVAPPPALKTRIDADLFGASSPARRPFAGWRGIGWLIGGAVAAVLLLLLTVNGGLLTPEGAAPGYTAEIAAEDGSMLLEASYDANAGTLDVAHRRGTAPEGRALELWLIAGDAAPVSLGVLPEAGSAHLSIATDLRPQMVGGLLAITDEPPGGAPEGKPTGEIRASGTVIAG